jgi:hypothetical protein
LREYVSCWLKNCLVTGVPSIKQKSGPWARVLSWQNWWRARTGKYAGVYQCRRVLSSTMFKIGNCNVYRVGWLFWTHESNNFLLNWLCAFLELVIFPILRNAWNASKYIALTRVLTKWKLPVYC